MQVRAGGYRDLGPGACRPGEPASASPPGAGRAVPVRGRGKTGSMPGRRGISAPARPVFRPCQSRGVGLVRRPASAPTTFFSLDITIRVS